MTSVTSCMRERTKFNTYWHLWDNEYRQLCANRVCVRYHRHHHQTKTISCAGRSNWPRNRLSSQFFHCKNAGLCTTCLGSSCESSGRLTVSIFNINALRVECNITTGAYINGHSVTPSTNTFQSNQRNMYHWCSITRHLPADPRRTNTPTSTTTGYLTLPGTRVPVHTHNSQKW